MIFRMIFFAVASMAISFIAATIQYYRDTHCVVKFEGLVLTGDQFLIGSAVAGIVLSFM